MFLRKYGTGSGSDVIIPMVKRGVVDFAVTADWTPASGDVKVSKDGGTEANIATLPVINGTVGWKFVFSDAELQCKSLTVRVVDSATKAVEDQFFVVETYGNASAMFVVDFSTAAFGANTTTPPTVGAIADQVWDEARSGHVTAGTFGEKVIAELDSSLTAKINALDFDGDVGTLNVNVKHYRGTLQSNGDLPQKMDSVQSSVNSLQTDVDASNNYLSALSAVFSGITSMANWLRRGFRKDSGTAGMTTAQTEINSTGGAFSGLTDSLEAIRDNQQSSGGASLEDIIAGVQSVSNGIIAAQDESALYITIGDTWTQDIESLGNLTDKTVTFAIKSKARDADTAAVVMIVEGTGLTRLNGAATTAGWGSIEILDETAGDIRLRLESDATALLTSGTYIDAVKALEDGDDRTLRQRGRTVVSVGVIANITT